MIAQVQKLFQDALQLPDAERATLVGWLIDSLDKEVDDDAQAAWEVEIERRLEQLATKAVKPIPWAEARRMILGGGDGAVSG